MIPEKYEELEQNKSANYPNEYGERELFDHVVAYQHAKYLVDMSFRYPILYLLWFRWWVPSLLREPERKREIRERRLHRARYCLPYWAEFSLYHPILFLVWLFFERLIKFLARPIKVIRRLFKL